MKKISDLCYKENLCLNLYLPDADVFPLFVYFHGGGLTSGDRTLAEPFAADLAERKIAVASVDYRMYPEAKYPDYLLDAADAIAFLKDHIAEYGTCKEIFVGGSSAGGYLSMMLCFCESFLKNVGLKGTDIAGWIHDAGQPTVHFNVLKELGYDTRKIIVDEKAPMWWIKENGTYSRMLFIVSDNDMTNRLEQTRLMLSTLRHFGVPESVAALREMHSTHCGYVFKCDENGKNIFGQIAADFILNQKREA